MNIGNRPRLYSTRLFFLIQILYFLIVPQAFADQEEKLALEQTQLNELSIEELMNIQVATVFGASKYEQKVTEAPSSISIVTADEIRKYGYRTMADIIRSQRGFYATYDRNYSYMGVRGFGRPGDYNSRVLILMDGHRLNDNVYNSGLIGTEGILDVDLVDHVEIIRGPSSSLYGTSAFFGVVNIITRRGRDLGGVEVSGSAASFGTYAGRLSYGNAFQSGPEVLLSGSVYDSKGQDLFFQGKGWSRDSDYDSAGNFFTEASFRDFTLTGAYVARKKGVPTGSYDTVFNNSDTFTKDERGYIELKYEHSFSGLADITARVSYDSYKYDADYIYDWADPGDPPDLVANKDYAKGQWWSAGLQINKTLFEKHRIIAGLDFEDNFQQDQGNYDRAVYLDDERSSTNWALYLQDEYRILSNLILNAGVRYDHYDTFGGTTNPRIALIYSPFAKTTAKLLYGSAFRAPNVFELYYDDGGVKLKSNPQLEPEEIKTYEIVLEQYLGEHFRMTATGFNYRIKDLISQQPEGDLLIFRNVENIDARGVELEVEGKWDNGLRGRLSYSYQDVKDKDKDRGISNSPNHLAKLNVIIPLLKEKIFAGTEIQYMSSRTTVDGKKVDDFFITNVTLFSQNLIKGLDASVSIYNLFDKRYRDPVGAEITNNYVEQDGISIRMKLTYKF